MYRIKDEYGNIIGELVNPTWLKQQKRVDRPINANSYEEANGIVLSDEQFYGIYKVDKETGESVVPNMNNYPQVTVEEISGEPYIMQQLAAMQEQLNEVYQHQTEETVLRSELDTAYTQGVNTI